MWGKKTVNPSVEQVEIVVTGKASSWEFHKAAVNGKKLLKWNL